MQTDLPPPVDISTIASHPGYQVLYNRKLLTAEAVETEYPAQRVERCTLPIAMNSLL
jgi:hypothetical protein